MKKRSLIAISGVSASVITFFSTSAAMAFLLLGGVAYDIYVFPPAGTGGNGYSVQSTVGGGTTPVAASNKAEVIKGICDAANNNGNPLPPNERASGGSVVHPPGAYTPAQPSSKEHPQGVPEGWKSQPSAKLSDCCKQNAKGEWEPATNPSAKCTEGMPEEPAKTTDKSGSVIPSYGVLPTSILSIE